jgi:hypothetical protein
MSVVIEGKEQIDRYTAIVLKTAIKMYVECGIQANKLYTPKNMLRKAGEITGKTYKRGQLAIAHTDLSELLK